MSVLDIVSQLGRHRVLQYLTLDGLMTFTRILSHLRRDILQLQPLEQSNPSTPLCFLPENIQMFLSECLGIALSDIGDLWNALRDHIWVSPLMPLIPGEDFTVFKAVGWKYGLSSAVSIYPPSDRCTNINCLHRIPLKKEFRKKVIVYTQGLGVQPAYNISIYCPKCCTSYHHNYSVQNARRTYYPGIPNIIQVGDHQFVETKVIASWQAHMLFGWFSASNASRTFYSMVPDDGYYQPNEWGLSDRLTTLQVWDGFLIFSLLEDAQTQGTLLNVPHSGDQSNRFKEAMEARNKRIIMEGQPDAVQHACDLCMRVFLMPDGTYRKCQAIVGDGLSIGRPRCGVSVCREPLENNRHRFCKMHDGMHDICAIVRCKNPVDIVVSPGKVHKKKMCSLQVHQQIESKHRERTACISQPVDSFSQVQNAAEQDIQEDFEVFKESNGLVILDVEKNTGSVGESDVTLPNQTECPDKNLEGNRTYKAHFGRSRTHNEQTLVRPCGVIFAHATMYNAEAVSNFLVMVKNAFSVPGSHKPEHIFYDTNCLARQQAEKDPWYDGIGMCVDAWHFRNKHAVTHQYCQLNCNPAQYPELMDDNSTAWFFNTSIAEQTNVWLGGYHSMCREMLPAKYDFFLDEMIRLRNIQSIQHLYQQGHHPHIY
ncbi:hypothetical protein HYPSUDRAFT_72271 [Hypholoma sublateritium FD-334 SS-4]|uniref:CxC5 like cysteine cluster associated with KDZ domain-containing protein n=1 Tax=Hypholoma sublateritium (strain FD-334 SS-4) TaxID=945553 RepID=A0A0D2P389_HYPSF|nr:hypothetical protein HYPSUDRAFT_72271 [Hypholoma sublateritium FD-334 SS-4]